MSELITEPIAETGLIVEQAADAEPRALADLRTHALSVPVETMQRGLAEYFDRRTAFRDWLRSKLVSGVHYGYPPGCEPKYDDKGNYLVWIKGGYKAYPPDQWQPKPSLYQAGADFICDLMGTRPEFAADLDAWKQMGEPKDTFVFACRLFNKSNHLLGEGRGVRKVGDKGGDANNAIKMAMKAAKVAAVLNTWGLADLWTQDLEDGPPPAAPAPNPPADPSAPQAQPRGKRDMPPLRDRINRIGNLWRAANPRDDGDRTAWSIDFKKWVIEAAGRTFNAGQEAQWSIGDCERCEQALGVDAEGMRV